MKYTKVFLEKIVKDTKCIWDVIEKLKIKKQEGNYRYIRNLIHRYEINISHFENQRKNSRKTRELKDILVKNSFLTISGNKLKDKLYKANLKERKCEICGQDENWNGKKMSLILDHINGDRMNNEIGNLRIVCPNCNATLDTHCGKNK